MPTGTAQNASRNQQGEEERAQLELIDKRPALICYGRGSVWYEESPDTSQSTNAYILIFRNKPAATGRSTVPAYGVTAHLLFRSGKGDQIVMDRGTWLGHYTHFADFKSGTSHKLVVSTSARASGASDGAVYVLDNPIRIDPRCSPVRSGITYLHAPNERPLIAECSEVEVCLISGDATVYSAKFECSANQDGTMKNFSLLG